ncbi:MAG TPA: PRC-barrel domain-containing protein [Anaerolineales bacterium]|nr:PRC-barrel domain-containing protein [Anaerolineales bacterium]
MRKFNLLLSIMVLAALLLAACGAEETQTSTVAPGTDVPTEEATATEAPAGTETVMPEGTTTAGIPVTGEDDPSRLSNQLDFDVWNQNGEQIGEVNDMILDLDNTRVSYVIVGTGGFLEIGEKDVLVPWESLDVQTAADGGPAGDQNAFILNADQALFENAPDVDLNTILPGIGEPTGDWEAEIRSYWESGVGPATEAPEATASPEPTAAPEMTETVSPDATALPEGTEVGGVVDLQGVALASEILGSGVTLSPGQGEAEGTGTDQAMATADTGADATATVDPGAATATIDPAATGGPDTIPDDFTGTIEDMIVNIDTGDIRFVVINSTFEEGERWIPIPLSFFQWDATNGSLAINTDSAMLLDAPFFEDGVWPDMTDDTWDDEFEAFWQ